MQFNRQFPPCLRSICIPEGRVSKQTSFGSALLPTTILGAGPFPQQFGGSEAGLTKPIVLVDLAVRGAQPREV